MKNELKKRFNQYEYLDLTYLEDYKFIGTKSHGLRSSNLNPVKVNSTSELPEVFFKMLKIKEDADNLYKIWNKTYFIEGILEKTGDEETPSFRIIPRTDFENDGFAFKNYLEQKSFDCSSSGFLEPLGI